MAGAVRAPAWRLGMVMCVLPEWKDIEAGEIPDSWEQVCLMAVALRLGRPWMALLEQFYAGAWEK